jgi:tungstate transport system ATP-binding protein
MTPRLSILPLRVTGLTYRAGKLDLLREISFELGAGEKVLVLGPNGAGKSVLLRLLHGLLVPSSGTIAWSTQDRDQQAMVFQRPVMFRRSVRDNLAFALSLRSHSDTTRIALDQRIHQALALHDLHSLASRPARLCSVGEQQRIALARAWALRPRVLFLDEPSASLDPSATKSIETALLAIHQEKTTLVMASHDLGQARRLADRVLFLHRGQLIEDAPAAEFFTRPRSPLAEAFLHGELLI